MKSLRVKVVIEKKGGRCFTGREPGADVALDFGSSGKSVVPANGNIP